MIQFFWIFDFIGLFLGRIILAAFLLKEFFSKESKFLPYFYLILSFMIFLGYFSSFAFLFLILLEIFNIIKVILLKRENLIILEKHFLRLGLAIVYLFIGPGYLSLDALFHIRF